MHVSFPLRRGWNNPELIFPFEEAALDGFSVAFQVHCPCVCAYSRCLLCSLSSDVCWDGENSSPTRNRCAAPVLELDTFAKLSGLHYPCQIRELICYLVYWALCARGFGKRHAREATQTCALIEKNWHSTPSILHLSSLFYNWIQIRLGVALERPCWLFNWMSSLSFELRPITMLKKTDLSQQKMKKH